MVSLVLSLLVSISPASADVNSGETLRQFIKRILSTPGSGGQLPAGYTQLYLGGADMHPCAEAVVNTFAGGTNHVQTVVMSEQSRLIAIQVLDSGIIQNKWNQYSARAHIQGQTCRLSNIALQSEESGTGSFLGNLSEIFRGR